MPLITLLLIMSTSIKKSYSEIIHYKGQIRSDILFLVSVCCYIHGALCYIHGALYFLNITLCYIHGALCYIYGALYFLITLCYIHGALCYIHGALCSQKFHNYETTYTNI